MHVARTEVVVSDVWSYNQGTVLGALVTLGDAQSLERAAHLVAAVSDRLTTEVDGTRLLRTHGGGDGGLFTGILGRYLALAATTEGLSASARDTAAGLVTSTAHALWRGRDLRGSDLESVSVWSPDPTAAARVSQPPGAAIELSTQVQAWTLLEAAAAVGRLRSRADRALSGATGGDARRRQVTIGSRLRDGVAVSRDLRVTLG